MIKNNKIFNSCLKAGGVLFCIFVAALFAVFGANVAQAQTAMVTEVSVNYPSDNYIDSILGGAEYQCTAPSPASALKDVSFITTGFEALGANHDPWKDSALIEFDQPFKHTTTNYTDRYLYPNHCLRLCAQVTCANPTRKTEGSTGTSNTVNTYYDVASSDFPIQSVLFEIFKYQPNSNPYNADTTPPIRTIALTPVDNNVCPGVGICMKDASKLETKSCCGTCQTDSTGKITGGTNTCTVYSGYTADSGDCSSTCLGFKGSTIEECRSGMKSLDFCAAWDGSYEIDGEFGKSNGQFGFRANIQTKWPGDGISSGDVEVNHTMAYPGVVSGGNYDTVAQIPIQVDVTNVHSVRSSSTMVGAVTKVPAQPYDITYKLSKDALTTIQISDPGDKC